MADFCKQCTLELFGPEMENDFKGLTTEEDTKNEDLYKCVV